MFYRICTRGELGSLRSGLGQIYALHLTHQKVLFLCFNASHRKLYYFHQLQWMKCCNVGEIINDEMMCQCNFFRETSFRCHHSVLTLSPVVRIGTPPPPHPQVSVPPPVPGVGTPWSKMEQSYVCSPCPVKPVSYLCGVLISPTL
jgi:hypothetical protein